MLRQDNTVHISFPVLFMIAICLFVTVSCTTQQSGERLLRNDKTENGVIKVANEVLIAFEQKNGKRLANFVHPKKGVRFSPSAFVDINVDRVLSRDQIERFWLDLNAYLWGYSDGSGAPIILSTAQYCQNYILTRDFRQTTSVNINEDQASGNTANNASMVYPNATRIEYYIKNSTFNAVEQLDWVALRLVFERIDSSWFLVGVIHDQWSV